MLAPVLQSSSVQTVVDSLPVGSLHVEEPTKSLQAGRLQFERVTTESDDHLGAHAKRLVNASVAAAGGLNARHHGDATKHPVW